MTVETLRIAHRNSDYDADILIEDLLPEASEDDYDRIFRKISNADIDLVCGLPLWTIAWPRLGFSFTQTSDPPMAITHLIIFYQLLNDEVADQSIGTIETLDLDPEYQAVVSDVAAANNLEIRGTNTPTRSHHLRGLLTGLLGLLIILIDQLLSIIWMPLKSDVASVSTVFVPLVNRFDSMQPVIDAYGGDYQVVVPTATVDWLRDVRHRVPELNAYNPIPIGYFAGPKNIAREIFVFTQLAVYLIFFDPLKARIQEFVTETFDVDFDATLSYVLGNFYRVHLRALPNVYAAEQMLDQLQPTNLVVGSLGSRQQAILHIARSRGCQTYHVPHTATTGYELLPPADTVHFVPGDVAVQHLRESEQTDEISNLIPAGRPQLAALYNERPPTADLPTEPFCVVIATQPFDDYIRATFVCDVLNALDEAAVDYDPVIKIHPNESISFYESVIEDQWDVRIATSDLTDHLRQADLAVTINSNVGLEAMVIGTPTVCVNEWFPMVRTRPYALAGPVPILESSSELILYLESIDTETLVDLQTQQHNYLQTEFNLTNRPAERIAELVQADELLDFDNYGGSSNS